MKPLNSGHLRVLKNLSIIEVSDCEVVKKMSDIGGFHCTIFQQILGCRLNESGTDRI